MGLTGVNMKKSFRRFSVIFVSLFLLAGCASKPVEEEPVRKKGNGPVKLTVIDSSTPEEHLPQFNPKIITDESEDSDISAAININKPENISMGSEVAVADKAAAINEPATIEKNATDDKTSIAANLATGDKTINFADYFYGVNFDPIYFEDTFLNYQSVISLMRANIYEKNVNLPKAGDTVTLVFKGLSDVDIPVPVYISLVELLPPTLHSEERFKSLVSPDVDESYVVFTQNIKAGELFENTVSFTLCEDCMDNILVHMVYTTGDGIKKSHWVPVK